MFKIRRLIVALVTLSGVTSAFSQSSVIKIDLATTTREPLVSQADAAYLKYRSAVSGVTARNRQSRLKANPNNKAHYLMPATIRFARNGVPLATGGRGRAGGITLDIDPTFNLSAPGRVAFMQQVFADVQPTLDAMFGAPAISGTVKVVNFDASIGDRQALTGGYYLPNNGSGGREIRLPLYTLQTTTAVALIHCILLAYLPDPAYAYDAYLEGLVRATTAKVCRLPGAVPLLDQDTVANLLDNSYDTGATYDWSNQKSLGGPTFIAPNLLATPVPDGTFGGIFLERYRMAGSVWLKVLTEYPTFAKDLNAAILANPSAATNASALEALAVSTLEAITPGGTIEGIPYGLWFKQQGILQTKLTVGTKLHAAITPLIFGVEGNDFGTFILEPTWFETLPNGNETLLSGTSYPIYWDKDYLRILADAQSERIDIASSYGSVVPNFADNSAGRAYRVAIDIPIQDRIVRSYVPAGAIATAANPTPNDFYGTIVGVLQPSGSTLSVNLNFGSESVNDIPVNSFAFGARVNTSSYLAARQVTITVIRRDLAGTPTTVLTRKVNKSVGALGVELGAAPVVSTTIPGGIAGGLQMVGLSGEPLASDLFDSLGLGLLAARYNSAKAKYDLYPQTGLATSGQGYFVRGSALTNPSFSARVESATAVGVALRPGWNLISNPLGVNVPFNRIQVVRTSEFPRSYIGASGNDANDPASPILGKDVFRFNPGAVDSTTGFPEGGSFATVPLFEPGVGYFVRCLAPEGAVMLFGAPGDSGRGTADSRMQSVFRATLSGKGESSAIKFGMSSAGTNGFDPRLDSNLPPTMGGMQISVLSPSGDRRFSEFRGYSASSTYRMTLDGLVTGRSYTFVLDPQKGRWTSATARNIKSGATVTSGGSRLVMSFVASTNSVTLDVTLRGVR